MSSSHRHRTTRTLCAVAAAALGLALVGIPEPASASTSASTGASTSAATFQTLSHGARPRGGTGEGGPTGPRWAWPVAGPRSIVQGYRAPASRYSAGHRGIDIGFASKIVVSPAAGTVRFSGVVVDRSTVTIEMIDGVLISMEPVVSTAHVGEPVARGAPLGEISTGGHCAGGCLHLGVRVDGEYVSPLRYFGGVRRAVLLPIGDSVVGR